MKWDWAWINLLLDSPSTEPHRVITQIRSLVYVTQLFCYCDDTRLRTVDEHFDLLPKEWGLIRPSDEIQLLEVVPWQWRVIFEIIYINFCATDATKRDFKVRRRQGRGRTDILPKTREFSSDITFLGHDRQAIERNRIIWSFLQERWCKCSTNAENANIPVDRETYSDIPEYRICTVRKNKE